MAKIISSLPSSGGTNIHNSLQGLNDGDYIHLTATEKAYFDTIDDQLAQKEDLVNKQDSLAVDGTGTKYPTVDAVNAGISAIPGQTENFNWKFNTSTTASDPGNGFFRANNISAALTTALYVDEFCDQTGLDIDTIFNTFNENWEIYIQQTNDASKFARFQINGTLVNNIGWWTIPVSFIQSGIGGALTNNTKCTFYFVNKNSLTPEDVVEDVIVDGVTDKAPSQNAVYDALQLKADLNSPTFTGDPKAPTPLSTDNDTSIATTAYVQEKITQLILDGDTEHTPSSNVVYDALILKENAANKQNNLNVDGTGIKFPTVDAVNDEFDYVQSTGILYGGALTVNADPTKFDIAAGSGYIINSNNLSNVTRTKVTWNAILGTTVTNIGTQPVTYIYVNADGSLHQTSTFPSDAERRAKIFIGRLNHSNLASVTFTDTFPDMLQGPISQYFDLTNAIGAFSYNGNIITANGANLSINKTNGKMYNASFNYLTNNQSPNNIDLAGLTLVSFRHQNRNSTDGANVTVIDPTNYDVGGVTTPVPNPISTATAMRVYLFPSNIIRIQRGQAIYTNLADAISGYKGEVFVENPANTGVAVWIATICIQKNSTSLLDTTTSRIIIEPKFGGSGGAAGVTTATLQTAYNNSTVPQIITDLIRGGVTVRRGSAADTDTVLVVQNGAGTITWSVDGYGNIDSTPQITIVTAVSIDTTTTVSGRTQKGRNVVISNGANAINYTVNASDGFVASYVKHGAAAITFVAGSGRTLVQVDGTNLLNGALGSTATISSVGTVDYLRISNA